METISIRKPSICVGCLSEDRKLLLLNNSEFLKTFYRILDTAGEDALPPLLCWECCSRVKGINKFKIQVENAQFQLKNININNKLKSLSTLQTHTSTSTIQYTHRDVCDDIKLEIDDDGYNNENMFVSDFYMEDNSTETKNTIHKEVPIEKSELRIDEQNRTDEFDASDDEPLNVKRQKREEVKKRVRKKKKEDESTQNHLGFAKVINNARVLKKLEALNVPPGQIEKVMLSWEQVELEREKALKSVRFTRHDYRCYDCVLGFNHKFKLDNHMKKHDPSSGPCVCGVCRVRSKDAHALYAHKRRHQVRWRCTACGALSSVAGVAADHVSRAHATLLATRHTHRCSHCNYTTETLGKLRNHLKNHAERQRCEQCGKTFRDRTSLKTHLFIHKKEKEYSCDKCDKRFHFKKAMEVHMVTHEASQLMYCYECDMNFKNQMSFYQHMKYNLKHIDPARLKHVCSVCGKRFAKSSRLEEHAAAVHLKRTSEPCTQPDCKFWAPSRAGLRAHVSARHGAAARRDHVCHTCGRAYSSKKTLEGHLRSHSSARPFACVRCGATFRYQAALYNHNKRLHPEHTLQNQVKKTGLSAVTPTDI